MYSPLIGWLEVIAPLGRCPALVELAEVVIDAPAVHESPSGRVGEPDALGHAREAPPPHVVASDPAVRFAVEGRPGEPFVGQGRGGPSVDPLPVVRGGLPVSVRLEEGLGHAVHLEVLLNRGQMIAPVAREVAPTGDVELVVGQVRDPMIHDNLQVGQHCVTVCPGQP